VTIRRALPGIALPHPLSTKADKTLVGPWRLPDGQDDAVLDRVPAPLNGLIGRALENAAVGRLLQRDDVRLITLTGPGGVGKTRLALALASAAREWFADGVVFVPLAPVQDVALVPAAIADQLDVQESGEQSLSEDLIARLRGDSLLLVLDNFEHLLDAVPLVTELLRACPGLNVLATSRRRLSLSGEHEVPVSPLAVADQRQPLTVEQLAAVPAIQLFVARAQAVTPSFALTEVNGPLVAEICQRLDGLPLAIELAAPRTRVLSPAALLSRLTNRLQLLTDGPRDAPERLQTMRRAIGWSYDLLDPELRALLRGLAVFVGGFRLEAAEAVGGDGCALGGDDRFAVLGGVGPAGLRGVEDETTLDSLSPLSAASPPERSDSPSVLDLVTALADESLLQTTQDADGERRFGMLETVREYALEQLQEAGEEASARRRHAEYCLRLVEHLDPTQSVPNDWLDRLQAEHDNLRAALAWAIEREPELALRLAGGLWRFWSQRGYWSEGRGWLGQALAAAPDAPPVVRADALAGAGRIAVEQGDFTQANQYLAESFTLAQQIGDDRRIARAMQALGIVASNQGELDRAEALFEGALARLRALADQPAIGRCLNDLGLVADRRGDHQRAVVYYEEALSLIRSNGDQTFAALLLGNLAGAYMGVDDWARGEALTVEALDQSRILGDRFGTAINLYNLADCLQRRGDVAAAWDYYRESLSITHELGERHLASRILDRIAHELTRFDLPRQAAHLLGAAAAQRRQIGDTLFPTEETFVAETIATTRAALSEEAFPAAWDVGASLSPDQAVSEALSIVLPTTTGRHGPQPRPSDFGLTAREIEVLSLVSTGRSDKEIATALTISRHTASRHVAALRAKLAAPSRTAVVSVAREAGLI
jgi:predicted ATPase/DNA-binding CsgD family transcriptional regulator